MGGGGGGGSFFSQSYTRIDCFQIAKKNFAVFFRFLPRINAAIRGRGLEAEKRPNIAVVFYVLYTFFVITSIQNANFPASTFSSYHYFISKSLYFYFILQHVLCPVLRRLAVLISEFVRR